MSDFFGENKNKICVVAILLLIAYVVIFSIFTTLANKSKAIGLSGEGSASKPYTISNEVELAEFRDLVNQGVDFEGKYVVLISDIDLAAEKAWLPIGNESNMFRGCFDGQGYVLTNLTSNGDQAGLFGACDGIICNLVLGGGCVSGTDYTGAVCAILEQNGAILNCMNMSEVEKKEDKAGGIAGLNKGTVVNCINFIYPYDDIERKVEGDLAKDIVGASDGGAVLQNCYASWDGFFDVKHFESEANLEKTCSRGFSNLNKRLAQLKLEYEDVSFNKWERTDEVWPVIRMSRQRANLVTGVYVSNEKAEYDFKEHVWKMDKASDDKHITFEYEDGKKQELLADSSMDRVIYRDDISEIAIDFDASVISKSSEASDKEYVIDLSDPSGMDLVPNTRALVRGIYEDSILKCQDTVVMIEQYGNYRLKNSLEGYVDFELPKKPGHLVVELDNASITSADTPAIVVRGGIDTGDVNDPTVKVTTLPETTNQLTGDVCSDIYAYDHENQGALSTESSLLISGQGTLRINAGLEGIEAEKIKFDDGEYIINADEDAINGAKYIEVSKGLFQINAGDDIFDVNGPMTIKNGLITGHTYTEKAFNSHEHLHFDGGTIATGSYFASRKDKESKQGIMAFDSMKDDSFKEGTFVVITDTDDVPIIAYRADKSFKVFSTSFPNLQGGVYHAYIADSVEGDFYGTICESPKNYNPVCQLSHDGETEFEMDKVQKTFELDEF